jgi:hypothetical protein
MASLWFVRQLGYESGPVSAQSLSKRSDTDIEVKREGSTNWIQYFDALEQIQREAEEEREVEKMALAKRHEADRRMREEIKAMEEARLAFYFATEGDQQRSSSSRGFKPEADDSLKLRVELQRLYIRYASKFALPKVALSLFEELGAAGVSWGRTKGEELAQAYQKAVALKAEGRNFIVELHAEVGGMVTEMRPDWSAAHGDHGTYEEVTEFRISSPQRIEVH